MLSSVDIVFPNLLVYGVCAPGQFLSQMQGQNCTTVNAVDLRDPLSDRRGAQCPSAGSVVIVSVLLYKLGEGASDHRSAAARSLLDDAHLADDATGPHRLVHRAAAHDPENTFFTM
jgi:hypothetical protein